MNEKARTIAVDFDGVIAEYEGWVEGVLGKPRSDTVNALRILRNEGWKIIVFSCREAAILIPYLLANDIPYDEVNPISSNTREQGKPAATVYWDDRAYRYSGDAMKDLDEIRKFTTWNGRT